MAQHHVWVRPEHMPTEMPGLVLEWRRNGPDWEALVTYVEPGLALEAADLHCGIQSPCLCR
jgi:hypothetical protein